MSKISEIKSYVADRGTGTAFYNYVNTEPLYLSRGVRKAYLDGDGDVQEVLNAVNRFHGGDFGTADNTGKEEGHEYGCYPSSVESDSGDDASLWVHRDRKNLIAFFKFER